MPSSSQQPLVALALAMALSLALAAPADKADASKRPELPSFVQACGRFDPQLERCVLRSVEALRPRLAEGLTELRVPPMEPLLIPLLRIHPSPAFTAEGRDVRVYGGSRFTINDLKIALNDTALSFIAAFHIPRLHFESDYQVEGRIVALPIKGNGLLTANVSDISGTIQLLGTITKRKSGEYLRFGEAETKLDIRAPVRIHLDNLFNGDKTLGEVTNNALNENSAALREVVLPVAEQAVSEFALDAANKISLAFPLEQLLPKRAR